jgi:hypothetical protein
MVLGLLLAGTLGGVISEYLYLDENFDNHKFIGGSKTVGYKNEDRIHIKLPKVESLPKLSIKYGDEPIVRVNYVIKKRKDNTKFWGFYPLIDFQTFLYNNATSLNPYHLQCIEANPKYKKYIELIRPVDKLDKLSINCLLWPRIQIFRQPVLKSLFYGESQNVDDSQMLALWREHHVDIRVGNEDTLHRATKVQDIPHGNKYDFINISVETYSYYATAFDSEYIPMRDTLDVILQFPKILAKGGVAFMRLSWCQSKMTTDMILLLQYWFEKVSIVKTVMHPAINEVTTVVCESYLGLQGTSGISVTKQKYLLQLFDEPSELLDTYNELSDQIGAIINNEIDRTLNYMDLFEIDESIIFPIQADGKARALSIYYELGIKPRFSLLFNKSDIKKFASIPGPFAVKLDQESAAVLDNPWQKLSSAETTLYLHKRYLDEIDWSRFKKLDALFRITSALKQQLRNKKVSQAFCKIREAIIDCNLLFGKSMESFHICEAPGQFVYSLQDLCKRRNIRLDWYAQSLHPDFDNEALDDTYGFMANNPERWLYGKDKTGDITKLDNILEYATKKYDLITSDCGITFKTYSFQEEEISFINYSQWLTMMLCLKKGGNCVLKTFLPLVKSVSVFMSFMMYQHFDEVIYFKPSLNLTSSEIYIVGKKYKGISNEVQDHLIQLHKNFDMDMKPEEAWNQGFLSEHYAAITRMIYNSIHCLDKYLVYYYYINSDYEKMLQKINDTAAKAWVQKYT